MPLTAAEKEMFRYLSLRLSRLNGEVVRLTDLLKAKGILSETELEGTLGSVEAYVQESTAMDEEILRRLEEPA
ncbi:hypothetical protein [Candidatus Nitrospira bockiana]